MGDPLDVGDDRGPFPTTEVFHSNLEIFHHRIGVIARKIGSKLVIETKAIVGGESLLDRWNDGRNVIGLRHLSAARESNDIFGKPLQLLDYLRSPAFGEFPPAPMTGAGTKNNIAIDRSIGQ